MSFSSFWALLKLRKIDLNISPGAFIKILPTWDPRLVLRGLLRGSWLSPAVTWYRLPSWWVPPPESCIWCLVGARSRCRRSHQGYRCWTWAAGCSTGEHLPVTEDIVTRDIYCIVAHRVLGLYVDLISSDNAVLLVVSRGSPVDHHRAGVEGFGPHLPGLPRHWEVGG